jgi:Uma2 family endonuclease
MQQYDTSQGAHEGGVIVQHRVSEFLDRWVMIEGPVPEAAWHDRALEVLKTILVHWVARTQRNAAVYRNLAIRVRRDKPQVGVDPDVMIVEPAPANADDLSSLRLWNTGHVVPSLAIEVVSPGHPYKDYVEIPDMSAALGVGELIVFDPMLVGPKAHGGPQRIQVWRRTDGGTFARVASGEGPFQSAFLGAYVLTVEGGRRLRIADDAAGKLLWPTPEESARGVGDAERAEKEAERAEKERALARIAELEEELRKRDAK